MTPAPAAAPTTSYVGNTRHLRPGEVIAFDPFPWCDDQQLHFGCITALESQSCFVAVDGDGVEYRVRRIMGCLGGARLADLDDGNVPKPPKSLMRQLVGSLKGLGHSSSDAREIALEVYQQHPTAELTELVTLAIQHDKE